MSESRSPASPSRTSATPKPITISFAGDIHFEGPLRDRLDDPGATLRAIAPQLSAADLAVVNLETALGTGGTPEAAKRFTFQAPASALDALAAAGVDVITMANNHALDFGTEPTLDALEGDIPVDVVGVGANQAAAFAPSVRTIDGTTIALLGASMADDPTADPTEHWAATPRGPGIAVAQQPERLARAVREAQETADVVAVYLHWGIQGESCPSRAQTTMAKALADAGADIVIGSHAHELQGAGFVADSYVAYGLGNFVWYQEGTTGLLTLTIDGTNVTPDWAPAEIQSNGLPRFATGAAAKRLGSDFANLSDCAGVRADD